MHNSLSGMLLLDKPFGITSFKAAHKIKKTLNVKKTGHCGTLDPAATGLLLILVGSATKLQDNFMKKDKVYSTSISLGIVTDTGDMEGKVIKECEYRHIKPCEIKKVLKMFEGEIEQIPPMFSALKYKGKKLYELARKGIEVERNPRKVIIKKIDFVAYKKGILKIEVACSSGTYIRTLAQDIGNKLGCGATVKELRRKKIGNFNVKKALKEKYFNDVKKIKSKIITYEKLLKIIEK